MKSKKITFILVGLLIILLQLSILEQVSAQEDITQWRNKTIMWVGPHQDDQGGSMGTLAMLQANGNKIILVLYTTGNKGSRDLEMTSERLAQIRRKEDANAMRELGIFHKSLRSL